MTDNKIDQKIVDFRAEIHRKSKMIIEDLEGKAINRELLARLLWLAAVSQSNIFLIGDPGTAKTYLAGKVHFAVKDSKYLEHMMTFDTKTEELFGVPVVQANGMVTYNIENSVIDSNIIFIDEIHKGSGQMLNSFLGVLHHSRTAYMRGTTRGPIKTDVMLGISASNEFEQLPSLGALADRFHFRIEVIRIQGEKNFKRFIMGDYDKTDDFRETVTVNDIKLIAQYAKETVKISEEMGDFITMLRNDFVKKKLKGSDRKIGYSSDTIMRVSAFCNERDEVDISDLFVLMHTLWENFAERDKIKTILLNTFFGTRDAHDEYIDKARNKYETVSSLFEIDGNNILYKRVDISPLSIQRNFESWRKTIIDFKNAFTSVAGNFKQALKRFDEIKMFEEIIGNNIFNIHPLLEKEYYIPKPYERTFDDNMVKLCENYIIACADAIRDCDKFLNECTSQYDYSEFTLKD